MRELKPCPFCGGKPHIMKMGYPHWVICTQCGAKVHGGKFGEKEGEAASIEAWNRRTSYSCDHEKDHTADIGKKVSISCGQENDLISRQAAIDALDKRFDDVPMELTTEILQLRRDLRERIPSAQPATNCSEIPNGSDDTISRQVAIDALDEQIEQCNKALGSFDISPKDEYAIKVERASLKAYRELLENLPSAQPEQRWIPIKNRLPAVRCCRCLITRDDGRGRATVEEALFSFGRWYSNEWLEDGLNSEFDISASVIAWAPFPAPYRGGGKE